MAQHRMAKEAVHQLTKSLACKVSGLPDNCLATVILPIILDTPMNRKWMDKAYQTTWTPIEYVFSPLLKWAVGEDRPQSGSLVKLVTEGG